MNEKEESLEDYIKNIEKQMNDGFMGLITKVEEIQNDDYFGEKGMFGEKDGYAIHIKIRGDNTEFSQWMSKPSMRGYKQSNMFKFMQKYGSPPKKGLEVSCFIDENGFYAIDM